MSGNSIRIVGIDPGLRKTGWGVIVQDGHRLVHIAHGTVTSPHKETLARRLLALYGGLMGVMEQWLPAQAAVEQTFVSKDAKASLKLGHARAVALIVPAAAGIEVAEYAPNAVKKSVTGSGHAGKAQIQAMVEMLLPRCGTLSEDEADALAIAITHAHLGATASAIARRAVAT